MFGLGVPEIAIILIVLAIFFFGGEKISEIARGLGRFTGEFKKGKTEVEKEIKETEKELKSDENGQK
ncbi:MAG: twin-arginine translocase TatA/TatE family subunit [Candidatus Parcubacteria bacterium]|nr:twin-arginine translocase TatA/TatE family subunit [Candidatus Parcubacteria bacterium]